MFEGERIRIRALEQSDIENVMPWVNNREVTRYLQTFPLPLSRLAEEKWLEKAAGHTDTDKFFAIETLHGEYIGNCGIHDIDSIHRHCELGTPSGCCLRLAFIS